MTIYRKNGKDSLQDLLKVEIEYIESIKATVLDTGIGVFLQKQIFFTSLGQKALNVFQKKEVSLEDEIPLGILTAVLQSRKIKLKELKNSVEEYFNIINRVNY